MARVLGMVFFKMPKLSQCLYLKPRKFQNPHVRHTRNRNPISSTCTALESQSHLSTEEFLQRKGSAENGSVIFKMTMFEKTKLNLWMLTVRQVAKWWLGQD